MAVADCARALALQCGADSEKAYLAGLLHDCAKHLDDMGMLEAAERYGIPIDPYERMEPSLLHAKVGEAIAREAYGIHDPDVLQAIRRHISGAPDMTPLDLAVNLADYIEPGRDYPGADAVRELAVTDPYAALMEGLRRTMLYVLERKALLHPGTLLTYNAIYMREIKDQEAFE